MIATGSFLPLTINPLSHFSFLTARGDGGTFLRYFADACDGLISHHGPSVSICNRSKGSLLTTSRFSSVFKLHPLTPMSKPMATSPSISSTVPVKLCTNPLFGSTSNLGRSRLKKSSCAALECKKRGSCTLVAMSSCASKYLSCVSLSVKWRRS